MPFTSSIFRSGRPMLRSARPMLRSARPMLVLLVACPAGVLAQASPGRTDTGVEGRVVEASNGEPIAGIRVRLLTMDGERNLTVSTTGRGGSYRLEIDQHDAEEVGPVVVEAWGIGYDVVVSDPFELVAGTTISLPDLELNRDPFVLDTIRVEQERYRYRFEIPPRERVLERQLRGRGTFLAGATIDNLPEHRLDWAFANHVEGLHVHPLRGLEPEDGCAVYLINQWPVPRNRLLALSRNRIGAMEVYLEFDDVPEELRHHVSRVDDTLTCGLINVWLWSEWNRGIDGGGG